MEIKEYGKIETEKIFNYLLKNNLIKEPFISGVLFNQRLDSLKGTASYILFGPYSGNTITIEEDFSTKVKNSIIRGKDLSQLIKLENVALEGK